MNYRSITGYSFLLHPDLDLYDIPDEVFDSPFVVVPNVTTGYKGNYLVVSRIIVDAPYYAPYYKSDAQKHADRMNKGVRRRRKQGFTGPHATLQPGTSWEICDDDFCRRYSI